MNILINSAPAAKYAKGHIIVTLGDGVEIKFPVAGNPRLARGTAAQLNNIAISPYGLHWADLDEDLSFKGLLAGDYGQKSPAWKRNQRAPEPTLSRLFPA
ncbi:MAG: DUF2442 domain-containing protein [Verrucomicrobiales bacterium]|jgi:hypothetical protein|nr:DUF2442 domain-containing protein [Verrucomicrobiales bacterium]